MGARCGGIGRFGELAAVIVSSLGIELSRGSVEDAQRMAREPHHVRTPSCGEFAGERRPRRRKIQAMRRYGSKATRYVQRMSRSNDVDNIAASFE